jgi:AsmA protein
MRRKLIIITGVSILVVVAVIAVAVSLLVNIDRFRPQLAQAMGAALGREVAMERISLSLLSGSAVAENLSIADDPAFGQTPFITAKSVRVGIAWLPLLTSKHLRVESLRLQEPRVTLRRSTAGAWNFSTLGASSAASKDSQSASSSSLTLSIDRLSITRGQVVMETGAARASRAEYRDLSVEVRDVSSTSRSEFAIGLVTPAGGTVDVNGSAGPPSARGLGSTPFEAVIDAAHVDIARSGFLDPGAGLAGIIDLHVRAASDGARISASGTLRGDKLQLVPGASPALKPIEVAYASEYNLLKQEGAVNQGDVRIGGATARLLGRFNTRATTPVVQLTFSGGQMPVTDLQTLLPAIGATLPSGARFRNGVVDADLTVKGPLDRLIIAGPIAMTDATLTGFDVGSRMQQVVSLAGVDGKGDTVIQVFRVTLRVAPDGVRADGLTCVVPSIGSLDGAGTIAPNGALDFKMLARLTHATGMTRQVARLVSLGSSDTAVPFRVTGTTASPVFAPDVARAASDTIKQPGTVSKATGFMRSLFGSNKQ